MGINVKSPVRMHRAFVLRGEPPKGQQAVCVSSLRTLRKQTAAQSFPRKKNKKLLKQKFFQIFDRFQNIIRFVFQKFLFGSVSV